MPLDGYVWYFQLTMTLDLCPVAGHPIVECLALLGVVKLDESSPFLEECSCLQEELILAPLSIIRDKVGHVYL
jgi:hypothetical protein